MNTGRGTLARTTSLQFRDGLCRSNQRAAEAGKCEEATMTNAEDPTKERDKLRSAIRKQMEAGGYRSLGGIILDGIGRCVQWAARRPEPPTSWWYTGGVVILINALIGFAVSLALGEPLSTGEIQLSVWAAALGGLMLIANKVTVQMFLETFRQSPLGAIDSTDDLRHFQHWLKANFELKRPLFFGLLFGPLLGAGLLLFWVQKNDELFHIGPLIVSMLAGFQSLLVIYYLYPFYVALPVHTSRYRFKLYAANPSSSQLIDELSDLFTAIMYITVGYIIFVILSMTYFKLVTVGASLFLVVMAWVPAVALFAGGQRSLSKVISKAKWETLRAIQAKIEKLQAEDITSKEALERLNKLIDYHDRIKNTQDSALNLRTRLDFLNSLLLPLIAFVLSNWSQVVTLLRSLWERVTAP
jgi:hypothetical protein